jgi:hypothetical protein
VRAFAGERGRWPASLRAGKRKGRSGLGGLKGERGRGRRGLGFLFFLKKLFKFVFSNFQTSLKQETMHSNHDAQALIISNFT